MACQALLDLVKIWTEHGRTAVLISEPSGVLLARAASSSYDVINYQCHCTQEIFCDSFRIAPLLGFSSSKTSKWSRSMSLNSELSCMPETVGCRAIDQVWAQLRQAAGKLHILTTSADCMACMSWLRVIREAQLLNAKYCAMTAPGPVAPQQWMVCTHVAEQHSMLPPSHYAYTCAQTTVLLQPTQKQQQTQGVNANKERDVHVKMIFVVELDIVAWFVAQWCKPSARMISQTTDLHLAASLPRTASFWCARSEDASACALWSGRCLCFHATTHASICGQDLPITLTSALTCARNRVSKCCTIWTIRPSSNMSLASSKNESRRLCEPKSIHSFGDWLPLHSNQKTRCDLWILSRYQHKQGNETKKDKVKRNECQSMKRKGKQPGKENKQGNAIHTRSWMAIRQRSIQLIWCSNRLSTSS